MNKYIALGNLTKDPETKEVGEYKVTTFGLAVNDIVYKNKEKQQLVTYIDIETWGKQAENCAKYLAKGKKVLIEGKLRLNSWEKNGEKRSKVYCIGDKVTFLNQEQGSDSPKSAPKKVESPKENVENSEDDDIIDDIPF
tara:strand:- start:23324 stop:23740 length:417 start_codon:yes stop_codon:yes gene_type:complete